MEQHTDVSLITGKLRDTGTKCADDDTSCHGGAVVKRNEELTVASNSASMLCHKHSVSHIIVMPSSHRRHRQDKTRRSSLVCVSGVN